MLSTSMWACLGHLNHTVCKQARDGQLPSPSMLDKFSQAILLILTKEEQLQATYKEQAAPHHGVASALTCIHNDTKQAVLW